MPSLTSKLLSTVLLASLAPALIAQPAPRTPLGVYAKVNISDEIKAKPTLGPAELNTYFNNLYQDLLGNPAISGLAIQVHWDTVNPRPLSAAKPYDWTYVDDAFNQTSLWNMQNPANAPKTIQLLVMPGFQTPEWVLKKIDSCDPLFQSPDQPPPATCGKVTFTGFGPEPTDGTELPLPWDPIYKTSWKAFLTALAVRYGSNPVFVSIAVAGPTASSDEMILPNNNNTPAPQFGGIRTNDMWLQLLTFQYPDLPAYQNSDQAFIDEWNAAIDVYAQVFSGVTLVVTTGSGLPNLGSAYTIPNLFAGDCQRPDMDCAAETTILSHLADPGVGGTNANATQTSGMEASRAGAANLGVPGVKLVSQMTPQILGGAQFNTTFSGDTTTILKEGCTSAFPPNSGDMPAGCSIPPGCTTAKCLPVACIPQSCLAPGVTADALASYKKFSDVPQADLIPPEQGEYNVLNVFFDGTAADAFFGATPGAAPVNYLQVFYQDIQYAENNVSVPAQVVGTVGASAMMSAQDLFNLASQQLLGFGSTP